MEFILKKKGEMFVDMLIESMELSAEDRFDLRRRAEVQQIVANAEACR